MMDANPTALQLPRLLKQMLWTSILAGSLITAAPAQANPTSMHATAAARAEQRQQQERQVRPDNYDLSRHPVTDANERHWRNMLWTTAVVEPQDAYVTEAIARILALSTQAGLSPAQKRTVDMAFQVGTQLYLNYPTNYAAVGTAFQATVERSTEAKWVAMAFSGLAKAGMASTERRSMGDRIRQRFPQWTNDVHLYTTLRDVDHLANPRPMPPLGELLNWTIAPDQLHMYVICQPDRGVLCQTVLKNRHGEFVRQGGQLWSVPLLLRSLHHLSWNFTRGESPQGIYRIEGTRAPDPNTFRAYGLFPLVKLFVPYEDGVQEFLPGQGSEFTGGLTTYQTLLPPSWRTYFPIQQSYWAGKAGRSLFRIHGSGEAPAFFSNNRLYPDTLGWNPSIGCLSATEVYDDAGRLQQADMPRILSALTAAGGQAFTGYLVVVEIPGNPDEPISIENIERAIAGQ